MFVILSVSEESFASRTPVRQRDSSALPQNDTKARDLGEHRKWLEGGSKQGTPNAEHRTSNAERRKDIPHSEFRNCHPRPHRRASVTTSNAIRNAPAMVSAMTR